METVRKGLRWTGWILLSLPFFLTMGIFRVIGIDAASAVGGCLARALAPIAPAHQTAKRNLAAAFPDLGETEIAAVVGDMWENLGRTFGEYAHFRQFSGFPNPRIAVSGRPYIDEALAGGKGALIVSGHLANWEAMAIAAYHAGYDGCEIYRIVNNPLINWWIVRQRKRWAYPLQVPKNRDGTRDMIRTLKDNKSVLMLIDQKFIEGVPVPFFGREAMTAPGPAVLSLRTGAAIVPVSIRRLKGAHFELSVRPPLAVAKTGNREEDTKAVLIALNRFLEEAIREAPAQWLWAHNRWKMPAPATSPIVTPA